MREEKEERIKLTEGIRMGQHLVLEQDSELEVRRLGHREGGWISIE